MNGLHRIELLDRTLNNGLHTVEPEAEAEIFRELQDARIDWIDHCGKVSSVSADRATDIESLAKLKEQVYNVIYEPDNSPNESDHSLFGHV